MPEFNFYTKEYLPFLKINNAELKKIFIISFVMGFIISFNKWGTDTVNILMGLKNIFIYSLISFIILVLYSSSSKVISLKRGYTSEFTFSKVNILLSLLFVFMTNGSLWFLPVANIDIIHNKKLRLGLFRYQKNTWEMADILFVGPFLLLLIAFFLNALNSFLNFNFITQLIKILILFVISIMLPIPNVNGMGIFFNSREKYFLYLGLTIGFAISIFYVKDLLISLLVAMISSLVFFYFGTKLLKKIE